MPLNPDKDTKCRQRSESKVPKTDDYKLVLGYLGQANDSQEVHLRDVPIQYGGYDTTRLESANRCIRLADLLAIGVRLTYFLPGVGQFPDYLTSREPPQGSNNYLPSVCYCTVSRNYFDIRFINGRQEKTATASRCRVFKIENVFIILF